MQLLVLAAAIINAQRPPAIVNQFWDDVVALPVVENGVLYDSKQPVISSKTVTLGTGRFGGQCMVVDTGQAFRYGNTPFVLAGDFTIEGHAQCTSSVRKNNYIFDAGTNGLVLKLIGEAWKLSNGGGLPIIDTAVTTILNQWYHFAVVRQGALIKIFIDGVMIGQTVFTAVLNAATFTWGNYGGGGSYSHEGKLDACRITLAARYTANFTPPMSPFLAGGQEATFDPFWDRTVLLIQGGTVGGNAVDLTGKGTVNKVLNASVSNTVRRFGDSSLKIPGDASYFSVANDDGRFDFNSTDFTVEGWLYLTAANGSNQVFGRGSASTYGGYKVMLDQRRPRIFISVAGATSWTATGSVTGSEIPLNVWTHIALTRQGSMMRLYINGVFLAQMTVSTLTTSAIPFTIGASNLGNEPTPGYIDSVRVTRGCRYTENFTPKLLSDFAVRGPNGGDGLAGYDTYYANSVFNARYIDSLADRRQTAPPTLVGTTVAFDNTRKLFGEPTMTMTTGANGNVAYAVNRALMNAPDFTVEAWVNTDYDSTLANACIASQWDVSAGGVWALTVRSTATERGRARFNYATASFIGSTTDVADGNWHHLAVSRRDGVITLYVDGVAEATVIDTRNFNFTGNLTVGKLATYAPTAGFRLNISDLRITAGISRYNTNFTPPTGFHPVSGLAA